MASRWLAVTALLSAACTDHTVETVPTRAVQEATRHFAQSLDKEVDILFVVDNSYSMAGLQSQLARQFPRLIDALRTQKLQGGIPDVRIGVVSSDLGAGPYTFQSDQGSCLPGGDGGKLQRTARVAGCTPPSDPWIEYKGGQTNVPAGASDPVERVKEAFTCIARLGDQGCGFEAVLEAGRVALDPKANRNPGFLRPEALLAVVFITNEDDCSARDPSLFDNSQDSLDAPLGPWHSFRCFEFGFHCDVNDRGHLGPRHDCKPAGRYLYDVDDYIGFFKGLKPEGRVLLAVIAGPPQPVVVVNGSAGGALRPELQPSCVGPGDPDEHPRRLLRRRRSVHQHLLGRLRPIAQAAGRAHRGQPRPAVPGGGAAHPLRHAGLRRGRQARPGRRGHLLPRGLPAAGRLHRGRHRALSRHHARGPLPGGAVQRSLAHGLRVDLPLLAPGGQGRLLERRVAVRAGGLAQPAGRAGHLRPPHLRHGGGCRCDRAPTMSLNY